jgi:hypothetical protein
VALAVAAGTVLLSDANRFLPPVQEKYTDIAGKGGADLIPTFNAACALLDGQNPYPSDPEKYPDPFAYSRGADENITYLYLPTHALVYVPIALLSGCKFDVGVRMQFFFSLLLLGVIGLAIADLVQRITPVPAELAVAIALISAYVLGLNGGSQLGLERGQSDLLTSALCWTAVALFCRGRVAAAAFLSLGGALLKGYGLALFGGLLLMGLMSTSRAHKRAAIVGSLVGVAVLLLPVARYLPDAKAALSIRTAMFWRGWVNQSLYSLWYFVLPSAAGVGRVVVVLWSGAVAGLSLWRWRSVWRQSSAEDGRSPELQSLSALHASAFATAALTLILSLSSNSIAYDGVLVLPGALILACAQSTLSSSQKRQHIIGVWLAFTMFWLCAFSVHRLIGRAVGPHRELPTHALGLFSLSVLIFTQVTARARPRTFASATRLP